MFCQRWSHWGPTTIRGFFFDDGCSFCFIVWNAGFAFELRTLHHDPMFAFSQVTLQKFAGGVVPRLAFRRTVSPCAVARFHAFELGIVVCTVGCFIGGGDFQPHVPTYFFVDSIHCALLGSRSVWQTSLSLIRMLGLFGPQGRGLRRCDSQVCRFCCRSGFICCGQVIG